MIFIYGIVSIIIQKNMLCKNKIRAIYFCLNYNHHWIIIAKIIFFPGSKKRDLRDKSRNGEDSKKHTEKSDSASSLPDDVFSDGFN